MSHEVIILPDEMESIVGRNRKTIWRWWRKEKSFPAPIQINGRAIGWREADYQAWLNGEWQN
ncbi:helix-turn-helix transcriptional regulator [Enterovibrio norvegicus]|uniref:helix-turn-helix transcriptional regulator n=1 Tax=Enterovibrio norvegicus TaxID=188144 RepID=UPI0002E1BB5E|nr:AlpA family phage regulatory protein [Enterovibrio norvegicus]OEF53828.1 AlpA family transcriptional regulator [Enterovibrio norvegicus]